MTPPRIGLAFSGGGFRATAFGLGCLRALYDLDLLKNVTVVSGISGGSLLAAMWAYGATEFDDFDRSVVTLLGTGLQTELVRRWLSPRVLANNAGSSVRAIVPGQVRSHNRTDVLVDALRARPFGLKSMSDVTHSGLDTVISATDLATGNAVRFGSSASACSPYGIIRNAVTVAEAVAASAAYPALLPAITRRFEFSNRDGGTSTRTLVMTDGGVYDNLGLSPLWPGRSRAHTPHVYNLDVIIAADAGRGRSRRAAARFMPQRLRQSFDITYAKTQDAARGNIHQLGRAGELHGFVHAYLGMRDENLPLPVCDLVPRSRVQGYPTNFAAMSRGDLDAVAIRGEQLTRTLVSWYLPDLAV